MVTDGIEQRVWFIYHHGYRFLAEDPDATAIFSNVHVDDQQSGEWNSHMLRVLGGMDIIINMMDDVAVSQKLYII